LVLSFINLSFFRAEGTSNDLLRCMLLREISFFLNKFRPNICIYQKKAVPLQPNCKSKRQVFMETKEKQERVNPTWAAAMKTQGSIVINDPAWRI